MTGAFGDLSGSGPQQVYVWLSYHSYNQAGNYSTWYWEVVYKGNNWGSWSNDTQHWSLSGFATGGGTFTIPLPGRGDIMLGSGTFRKYHDSRGQLAAGTLTASIQTNHATIGSGSAQVGSGTPPRIPKAPTKPAAPTLRSVTTNSISFAISYPSDDGGAAISTYNLQAATNSAFTQGVVNWDSGASSQAASSLNPGTQYWIRYRARNSVGASPWSDAITATTLPSVAPGMTVTPSVSGTSVSIALTPPQGSTSVTKYQVERRSPGGTATTYETTTSPLVISSMAPGSTFEYRASAFIGTYQSPWTDWVTRTQPRPDTSPGDYFDGSTADKPGVDYQWTGTANGSTSIAVAGAPAGWRSFEDGLADSGSSSGVVARVTDGRSGKYAARLTFFTGSTTANFRAGTSLDLPGVAEIAEGGVYWGSIYVSPSRAQPMAAELIWLDGTFTPIGTPAVGTPVTVPADADPMVRLAVRGTAPAGAAYGAIGWVDVPNIPGTAGYGHGAYGHGAYGSGPDGTPPEGDWSPWVAGDSVLMDDAMISIGVLRNWFSGDTRDNANWRYSWAGTPNASISLAEALDPGTVDLLADPDCPPIPTAPRPPSIEDSCLDETGTWRRYWAVIPEAEVYDWMSVVPTITLQTGDVAARQVRIRFYANPDALEPVDAIDLQAESEQIVSYMPPNTELILDGVSRRAWASVDGGDSVTAGHLLYGQSGGPATWPTLDCGSAYLVSFDVPLDAPTANLTVKVALTTRMM